MAAAIASPITRLADYVLMIGIGSELVSLNPREFNSVLGTAYTGEVVLRWPAEDRDDFKLPTITSLFAFPHGFRLELSEKPKEKHVFALTEGDGTRVYGVCVVRYDPLSSHKMATIADVLREEGMKDHEIPTTLYAPTALCILSHHPYFQSFLEVLFPIITSPSKIAAREVARVVQSLYNLNAPAPGFSVKCDIANIPVVFHRPLKKSLPLSDVDFDLVFGAFSSNNLVNILTCILNEKQMLFISTSLYKLSICIFGICSLLYPFEWQHVFIPVLPVTLLDFFQAPIPFIVGVHSSYLSIQRPPDSTVIVDIDNNTVSNGEPLTRLPPHYRAKIFRALEKYGRKTPDAPEDSTLCSKENTKNVVDSNPSLLSTSYSSSDDDSQEDDDDDDDGNHGAKKTKKASPMRAALMRSGEFPRSLSAEGEDIRRKGSDWVRGQSLVRQDTPPSLRNKHREMSAMVPKKIRKAFMKVFISLFKKYKQFVNDPNTIQPNQSYFNTNEFLTTVCEEYLPFCKLFVGTQMFQAFIQDRITSTQQDLFEIHVKAKMQRRALQLRILESASKTGELWKRGHRRKNWKKRWFFCDNLEVVYFKDKERTKQKGAIELVPGVTKIIIPVAKKKGQPSDFALKVVSPTKSLIICAPDAETRKDWVKLLKAKVILASQREELVNSFKLDGSSIAKVLRAREEPIFRFLQVQRRIMERGLEAIQRRATEAVPTNAPPGTPPSRRMTRFAPVRTTTVMEGDDDDVIQSQLDTLLANLPATPTKATTVARTY